jgi:hypothetical protein
MANSSLLKHTFFMMKYKFYNFYMGNFYECQLESALFEEEKVSGLAIFASLNPHGLCLF